MASDGFRLGDGFGMGLQCGHPSPELEQKENGTYCRLCGARIESSNTTEQNADVQQNKSVE